MEKISYAEKQFCPTCEKPSIGGFVHPECKRTYGLDGHMSATIYTGPIRSLITMYKKLQVRKLEEALKDVIATYFVDDEELFVFERSDNVCIIPVPLHKIDRRRKGFNQALVVAKQLSELWGYEIMNDTLEKHTYTKQQKMLPREKRLQNVRGTFEVKKENILNKEIILTDDVWTTGTTLRECCKVLKRNGAKSVWAITLAKGA